MQTSDHAPDGEVANGYTEEQAASEMLKRWGAKEESEASPEGEKPEEPDTSEADEATPDEQEDPEQKEPEESGEVEIDVAGEKFKFPATLKEHAEKIQAKAKEVEAGATRKFQEAADLRKAAEARAEQVDRMRQFGQAHTDLLADLRFVERRLAAYEQIPLQQYDTDTQVKLQSEYTQLTSAEKRLRAAIKQAADDFGAEATKAEQAREQALHEYTKNIRGWGAETDNRLNEYVGAKGISRDTMLSLLKQEPRLLSVLEEASFGQKVRTATPQKTPPKAQTIKPGGAGQTKTSAQQAAETANRRLGQTGKVDDAAAAILARMNARKR